MSLFCGQNKLDLSVKTSEELELITKNLIETKDSIKSEIVKLTKTINNYNKDLHMIDKDLKIIVKELTLRKDIKESKKIINEEIKTIEGFKLLSEDELSIITTKMDKTDYRKHGNYPRYLDLERICEEVINMKKKYPKWTLSYLSRAGQYDTLPPHTFYKYEYKDEYGDHFNLGGIKPLTT